MACVPAASFGKIKTSRGTRSEPEPLGRSFYIWEFRHLLNSALTSNLHVSKSRGPNSISPSASIQHIHFFVLLVSASPESTMADFSQVPELLRPRSDPFAEESGSSPSDIHVDDASMTDESTSNEVNSFFRAFHL